MNEFDLIAAYFKPLTKGYEGSLSLTDDAAIISSTPGFDLVVTKDAICESIHFLGHEDPVLIAQKLLRVNLSDLAAMGAKPLAYLLSLQLPKDTSPDWVKRFAQGLEKDQEQFGIHLAGGDTTSSHGLLACSITAFGTIPTGKALRRSRAQVGDIIYVSGTLGDSALGLGLIQGKNTSSLSSDERTWLEQRYFIPQPRVELGQRLVGLANAAMDISDGLMQDLGHICEESGVGAALHRHLLPLSAPAKALIGSHPNLWDSVFAGGDDYELLFTIPTERQAEIPLLSAQLRLPLTAIGHISSVQGVTIEDQQGQVLSVPRKGFAHF
jgi:thiamine-monophosphate kinase